MRLHWSRGFLASIVGLILVGAPALAQLVDRTKAPNTANEGIAKSYEEQIGAGRGNVLHARTRRCSSSPAIPRAPSAAGRQIFQRKFTRVAGPGPAATATARATSTAR